MKRPCQRLGSFDILVFLLACVCALFLIGFAWVGFTESDDAFYAEAAQGWVGHWYVAKNHWGLRHAIVLPMALAFGLFGRSEWTLVFPVVLYATLLLGLTFIAVRKAVGYYGGLIAVVLAVCIPAVATGASWVTTDLAETFFLLLSVWIFYYSIEAKNPIYLVLSGVAAGLGVITRETSVVLAAFYGLLMLVNYGGHRGRYVWIGLGAALVIGLDILYLGASTGDYIYRLHVSQLGVSGDNPKMVEAFSTPQGLDRFGTLIAPRWLQAWFVLFINQSFGIIPWLGVAAGVHLSLKGAPQIRRVNSIFLFFALLWFLVLSYAFTFLWLVPRYQIPTAFALTVPLAIWLAEAAARERYAVVGTALAAVIMTAVVAIGVSDRNPHFGERKLVDWVSRSNAAVVTDPSTLRGAKWMLEASGTLAQVSARIPRDGDIYLFSDRPRRGIPKDWLVHQPGPQWVVVESFEEPARPLARLMLAIGVGRILPAPMLAKLKPVPRRVVVYRVVGPAKHSEPA